VDEELTMSKVIMNVTEILKKRLPGATIRVDEPLARAGMWHVDVSRGEHAVVLQWSPQKGFGVSADPNPGLGEGPHEVYEDAEKAVDRVVHLVETGEHTRPPQEALLSALRSLLGVSQEELAARLKMRQANVSRLERQSDMKISTLRKLVGAIGADLEIVARVGEAHVKLTQFEAGKTGRPAAQRRPRKAVR
jgi:DNA-binding Xre family transcriptional regulator